jgi:hypothetical protein
MGGEDDVKREGRNISGWMCSMQPLFVSSRSVIQLSSQSCIQSCSQSPSPSTGMDRSCSCRR